MEIKVNASKSYSVVIENDLTKLNNYDKLFTGDKILIVTDTNVEKLFLQKVISQIKDRKIYSYVLPAGEQSKNAENYIKILNFLAENGFKRNDTIIALGGGVVGDITGFSSATYMRGINLIMLPTSLLAMVDSSVGGKTAIDLEKGKNLAGAFYQPSLVYIAIELLSTLPQREILSGMGEIIKYCFIGKKVDKAELISGLTAELIAKCVSIKRDIVEADEKESGERKLLNLGHTIGHAIEKISNYTLSHGECVLKGLAYALEISKKLGELTNENYDKAKQLLSSVDYDYSWQGDKNAIIEYVKSDKKGKGNSVDFVVIDNDLSAKVKTITIEQLYGLL